LNICSDPGRRRCRTRTWSPRRDKVRLSATGAVAVTMEEERPEPPGHGKCLPMSWAAFC
jgi:hypothetical protein